MTATLYGGEWSSSRPSRFTPVTHWIRGCVGPRTGLDAMQKRKVVSLPGIEPLLSTP
jgi:hypothetical protein